VHYISLFYDVFWSIIALFVDGSVCFWRRYREEICNSLPHYFI
jgi:hypothetical protein